MSVHPAGASGSGGSLGALAARVRVRRATEDEAFLLAALHLQALRRRGGDAPAHVQAFGQAWHRRSEDYPAWVAELDDQHVGLAICELPPLPQVGAGVPELRVVEALPQTEEARQAEGITLAMVREIVTWAGREGHHCVDVAPGVTLPGAVLDAARADVLAGRRVSLPTRP